MFCNNCGKEIQDGKKFCGSCGAPVPAAETSAPQPQPTPAPQPAPVGAAPAYQPQYNYYQTMAPKISKGEYLKTKAPANVKTMSLVSRIIGIVCILVALSVCLSPLFIPLDELAFVQMVDEDTEMNTDTFEDMLDDPKYEEVFDKYDNFEDAIKAVIDNPSLMNIKNLAEETIEVGDDIDEDVSELHDVSEIFDLVIGIAIGYFIFVLLLTALAILLRNNVFTVAALLFASLYALVLSGVMYLALAFVAYVALFVTQYIVNKNYKAYRG